MPHIFPVFFCSAIEQLSLVILDSSVTDARLGLECLLHDAGTDRCILIDLVSRKRHGVFHLQRRQFVLVCFVLFFPDIVCLDILINHNLLFRFSCRLFLIAGIFRRCSGLLLFLCDFFCLRGSRSFLFSRPFRCRVSLRFSCKQCKRRC